MIPVFHKLESCAEFRFQYLSLLFFSRHLRTKRPTRAWAGYPKIRFEVKSFCWIAPQSPHKLLFINWLHCTIFVQKYPLFHEMEVSLSSKNRVNQDARLSRAAVDCW